MLGQLPGICKLIRTCNPHRITRQKEREIGKKNVEIKMAKRCSLKVRKNFEIHCERKLKDRQFCPSFSQKSKRGGSDDICTSRIFLKLGVMTAGHG